jgi:hypothetical protein
MVIFSSLEPVFNGALTRLPRTRELLCPGTFVYFSDCNSDEKQVGRIIRCGSTNVTINIFQPPALQDNIASLSHSYLEGTVQVVQTVKTVDVDPRNILEVSFVIPYVQLSDVNQYLEVSGMELVRVLRGRLHNGCFQEIFTPSFPSSYEQFHEFYHLHDDVSRTKWEEVVLPIQALISRLLCRSYLLQGDNFCKRRSDPHHFNSQLWGWLSTFLASHGSPIRDVSLHRRSKRLLVRPTIVSASSIQSSCQIIRCETATQIKAVALLFGNCCLVGLRDAAPAVNNSVLLSRSTCNVIIPYPSVEVPFVLNTSRLGIDFEHNGYLLKITVRYCKVDGSHEVVRRLFRGIIERPILSEIVPVQQDLALVSINSFFKLNNGHLAYVVSIDQNGSCLCKEAQGEFPQDVVLPYDFVSNQIRSYRLEQLNR